MAKSTMFSTIFSSIMIAMFVFACIKVLGGNEGQDQVRQQIVNNMNSTKNTFWIAVMVKSLDDLTPSIKVYDIPFYPDKEIFLVNKFPLIAWSHVILITLTMTLFSLFVRVVRVRPGYILLFGILIIIISYFLGSIIDNLLYYYSAEQLGIAKHDALVFKESFNNQFDNVLLAPIIFGFLSFYVVIKYLFIAMRKRRKGYAKRK